MTETTRSIFDLDEFRPYRTEWMARQQRFRELRDLYNGTIYKTAVGSLGWLRPMVEQVPPYDVPLARCVSIDVGLIPGGWGLNANELSIEQIDAARTVLSNSKWNKNGSLFVRYGAIYGNVGLKIVDNRLTERVTIEPLNPLQFALFDDFCLILYTERGYEHAEVITRDTIRHFRNGQPFDYTGYGDTYENPLRFIPVIEAQHIDVGEQFGESTFQNAIFALRAANAAIQSLMEVVERYPHPVTVVTNAKPSDISLGKNRVLYLGRDSDVKIIVPDVPLDSLLRVTQQASQFLHESLPELVFDNLRRHDQIANDTLLTQTQELIIKIAECRRNYDDALTEALRLAGLAYLSMGNRELDSLLELPDEAINPNREIIPLDPEKRLRLRQMELALDMQEAAINPNRG